MIDFTFSDSEEINFDTPFEAEDIDADVGEVIREITSDYRQLLNRPSINGTSLLDNYDEIDPTVPDWAKKDNKPVYYPEEVGALNEDNEMHFSEIDAIFNQVFGGKK